VRLSILQSAALTRRQREVYDRLAQGPRQAVGGPFIAWLRSPELADRAGRLGDFLRFESSLPNTIIEIAILMIARSWNSSFVWCTHAPLALEAGVSQGQIDAIENGIDPDFVSDSERSTYALITELLETKRVSEATWNEAHEHLGEQEMVELLGLAGYYMMVVMTIVAVDFAQDEPRA